MPSLIPAWSSIAKPIIGMLHLPPLPGAPRFDGDLDAVVERVLNDAEALAAGGLHGLMLENFGDTPFYPGRVPAPVVAHMSRLAGAVRARFDLPLGINVLRNDAHAALAVAHASGAAFIRVNVLCGARVTDQGVIAGVAHELLRERESLQARQIKIFADVDVKHSTSLGSPRPIEAEVADTIERGHADVVVVSGSGTGKPADLEDLRRAKNAAGRTPVFVGSGVTPDNIASCLNVADGVIVGAALKKGGIPANPVDPERVRKLVRNV